MQSLKKGYLFFGIAVVTIILFTVIPPFGGLGKSAMTLLGIFFASVMLWITVGISWPSLFCMAALPLLLPEIPINTMIAGSVGTPTFSFLIFTFCCSYALEKTDFTKRCAVWFLSRPVAKKSPWLFMALYFFSVLLIGSCMSTTVIVLIYLTINEEIFSLLGLQKGHSYANMMTIGLIIVSGISGAMTPIAHVFPIMGLSILKNLSGISVSYAQYIAAGVPAAVLTVLAMLLIFKFILRPDVSAARNLDLAQLRSAVKPADVREKRIVAIFFFVVALWVLPDLLKGVLPGIMGWISGFGTVMPPLVGTMLLCLCGAEGKPLIQFHEAAKAVPWPSLFMAASALALGSAMSNNDIGLSAAMSKVLVPITKSMGSMALVLVLLAITAVMTNIGSNMVTITVVGNVALPILLSVDAGVNPAALAVVLGMMSTYAFALPPAMTTVALGVGSGWTTTASLAKYGFLTLIPSILFVGLVAYPIAAAII